MINILPATGGLKVSAHQHELTAVSMALQQAGIHFEATPYAITIPCPTEPHNSLYRHILAVLSEVNNGTV